MMRPKGTLLQYYGGKWKIAPWIVGKLPEHTCYTEAFGGGASVLLRKPPAKVEVYNDIDGDVVNLFRVMRDPEAGKRLCELVWATPYARDEAALSLCATKDPIERARRFVVRSYQIIGGHATGKTVGDFRVVRYRRTKATATKCRENVGAFTGWPERALQHMERLRNVVIENRQALRVLQDYDKPDTLHYVDPPYMAGTRKDAANNYTHELNDYDHVGLLAVLRSLRGIVAISTYRNPLYAQALAGWTCHEKTAHDLVSNKRVLR